MKKYIWSVLALSILLLLIYYLGAAVLPFQLHSWFPGLITFFFIQSIPIAWLLYRAQQNTSEGPIYILGSIGFRMITGLMLLIVFAVLKVEDINALALQFAVIYLLFLVFELSIVLPNLRPN